MDASNSEKISNTGIVTNNFSIHEISANGKQKIVFMLKRKQYSKAYQYLLLKEQMTRKQRGIEILSGIIASYLVGDMVWLIPPLVRNCKNYEEAIRQKKCGNYHKALLLFEQIIKYKDSRQYGAVCLKKYIKWGINNQKNIFIGVCKKSLLSGCLSHQIQAFIHFLPEKVYLQNVFKPQIKKFVNGKIQNCLRR